MGCMELKPAEVIDGKVQVKPFYIKREGNRLFRSDEPAPGYELHPAFRQMRPQKKHKAVGIRICSLTDKPEWINESGLPILVDFDRQPPWSGIKEEGGRKFIPPFYIKINHNSYAMWVSVSKLKGFRLHPSFKLPETRHGVWGEFDETGVPKESELSSCFNCQSNVIFDQPKMPLEV